MPSDQFRDGVFFAGVGERKRLLQKAEAYWLEILAGIERHDKTAALQESKAER
jgi:hypothetical protein